MNAVVVLSLFALGCFMYLLARSMLRPSRTTCCARDSNAPPERPAQRSAARTGPASPRQVVRSICARGFALPFSIAGRSPETRGGDMRRPLQRSERRLSFWALQRSMDATHGCCHNTFRSRSSWGSPTQRSGARTLVVRRNRRRMRGEDMHDRALGRLARGAAQGTVSRGARSAVLEASVSVRASRSTDENAVLRGSRGQLLAQETPNLTRIR